VSMPSQMSASALERSPSKTFPYNRNSKTLGTDAGGV
jgi:hypothetical protein